MDSQANTNSVINACLTALSASLIDLQDGEDSVCLFTPSHRVLFHDDRISSTRISNATISLA